MNTAKKDIEFLKKLDLVLLPYYIQINDSIYIEKDNLENINGLYIFFEDNIAQYVGRTNKNRLRQRIQEHSRKSSNKNTATFAYLIAQRDNQKIDFDSRFQKSKERVAKMNIKFIEVNEPITQTILEPYLSYKYNTLNKYNKFDTH